MRVYHDAKKRITRTEQAIQHELIQAGEVFNLSPEQAIDWNVRQAQADAAEAKRAAEQQAAEKAQMNLLKSRTCPM